MKILFFFIFRQQRRLLKMLAELEAAEGESNAIENWDVSKDSSKIFLQEQKNNRKVTVVPVERQSFVNKTQETNDVKKKPTNDVKQNNKNSKKYEEKGTFEISADTSKKNDTKKDITEVIFKLLSNWGNKECIGLTEVCISK